MDRADIRVLARRREGVGKAVVSIVAVTMLCVVSITDTVLSPLVT